MCAYMVHLHFAHYYESPFKKVTQNDTENDYIKK